MTSIPAVVVAAPSSGSGKTTVSTGLIGALRRAGRRVAPFKVGPDYIDPGYHAVAAGRVGRNLDPNLVGADLIGPLFAAGVADADIAVIEGVMGLFDGRITADDAADMDPIGMGSTAHVATLLNAPVVLVVDAAGHSQSLAALLHGFVGYEPSVRIAGVVLNRVGSPRHEAVLRQACARVGMPVLGVLRRDSRLQVPSRHLGLIPAAERSVEAVAAVDAMSEMVGAALDLEAIVALAESGGVTLSKPWSAADAIADAGVGAQSARPHPGRPHSARPHSGSPVVAIAAGAAFTFGYAEHAELLRAAGAEVVEFDPLIDRLPERTAGLVVGGGFPEEHADKLAANHELREDIAALNRASGPIHGECAGLLYLTRELDGHPMTGVIDAVGRFGPSLTLGYRDAVAVSDSALYRAGERVTGHEFHRSVVELDAGTPAWAWRDHHGAPGVHGVATSNVLASYLHVHPAAVPASIARFVRACESKEM
ncbi:cobyrinate a,c-diamide synthase [Gordonia sputi]|uniref:cobyrinate a,c-diamide synthase n=1 Tax=Gordonia sputi TaxID=36823 RepID=UPI00204320D6|nr:cobyrinate a,c-diamide synthase [Gordonia sputi]MCM3893748.1 cobyrinate a,c-diamide synthase [Gordonia sputi]